MKRPWEKPCAKLQRKTVSDHMEVRLRLARHGWSERHRGAWPQRRRARWRLSRCWAGARRWAGRGRRRYRAERQLPGSRDQLCRIGRWAGFCLETRDNRYGGLRHGDSVGDVRLYVHIGIATTLVWLEAGHKPVSSFVPRHPHFNTRHTFTLFIFHYNANLRKAGFADALSRHQQKSRQRCGRRRKGRQRRGSIGPRECG